MTNKDLSLLYSKLSKTIEANGEDTKLGKKMIKIFERIKPYLEAYQKEVDGLRLDNALTDDKDVLLLDEKGEYKFTKENLKKLTNQIEVLNNTAIDIPMINIVNSKGFEEHTFLRGWVSGVDFIEEEEL